MQPTNLYKDTLTKLANTNINILAWWTLAIATYVVARLLQSWLDASYANSQFPVPFYIGQTTFDANELKAYYQVLLDKGTLDIYLKTQLIDYVFMAGTFVSFFCLASAVMQSLKLARMPTLFIRIAIFFVWFAPLAAAFDALENLVSFIMLADPQGFANWLVMPYSSFAVTKFAIFITSYLWCIAALGSIFGVLIYRGVAKLASAKSTSEAL